MKYSITAFLRVLLCAGFTLYQPSLADSAEDAHSADAGATASEDVAEVPAPVPMAGKSGKAKKSKRPMPSPSSELTASSTDRPSTAQVDEWVRRLPSGFDKKFRDEYRKSLMSGTEPIKPGSLGEEGEPGSIDPAPETMRDRLQDRSVVEVPGTNTRIIFVERPRTQGQTVSPIANKKEEAPGQTGSPSKTAQENQGGLPTVIAARTGASANWDMPAQPTAAKWDTARAEKGFRALDTYLTTPPTQAEGERKAEKGAAQKQVAKGEAWSEQIVYLDDPEEGEEPSNGGGRLAGRSLNSEMRQASFNRNETDLGAMAKDTLQTLRRRADSTPLAGILVNLLLMLTGFTLLALMMAKRRRIATAGYPPSVVRSMGTVARKVEETRDITPYTQAEEVPARRPSSQWTEEEEETVTDAAMTADSSLNDDIRVVFEPRLSRWVLKRQDAGRLSAPLAELQAGTVVRGTALGSTTPDTRYRLSVTNTWILTNDEEQIIIAVKAHNFRAASR